MFQSTHCRCIDDSRNKRQSKTYVFTIFRDGIDTVSVSVASSCCPLKGNFTNGNWSRFLRPRSLESAPLSNNAREGPFLVLSFRITPYQAIYCPLIHGGFHNLLMERIKQKFWEILAKALWVQFHLRNISNLISSLLRFFRDLISEGARLG